MLKREKQNANVVGLAAHSDPLKQNGITLIALIITIIVMLILVGVTINVALNGGLFTKASDASKQMQVEADRETLLSAVVAAIGNDGKVVISDIELPTGWTGSNGTYTSPKGNTFTVTEDGKITGGNGENVSPTDNLAMLRAELQNKTFDDVLKSFDEIPEFNNPDIAYVNMIGGKEAPATYMAVEYKEEEFNLFFDDESGYITAVDINLEFDDEYFTAILKNDKALILGLTENGISNLEQSKKLTIPKEIIGIDGKSYKVSEIGTYVFKNNLNIETLEFEDGIQLETIEKSAFKRCTNLTKVTFPNSLKTIGESAFSSCDNLAEVNLNQGLVTIGEDAFGSTKKLTSITIPESVTNIGTRAFAPTDSQLEIKLEGRTEEPATTDAYSGTGFEQGWRNATNTTVVCLGS